MTTRNPNEKIVAGLTRYDVLVNAMKRVADKYGEWDDVDPDDGLSQKGVRTFARDVLKMIGEG